MDTPAEAGEVSADRTHKAAAIVDVTDDEAVRGARLLAAEESLLLGPASGAVVHAALVLAAKPAFASRLVVAVLPDRAEHYLDHRALQPEGR